MIRCIISLVAILLCLTPTFANAERSGKPQQVKMTWSFVDACDDGVGPTFEIYVREDPRRYWGTYFLQYYSKPLQRSISCNQGEWICYGAWTDDYSWGCGENCARTCKDCCYQCNEGGVKIEMTCD